VPVEVEREDAGFYYYRVYRPPASPVPPVGAGGAPGPAGPELLASYRSAAAPSERLAWAPFDRGLPRAGQWRDGFAVADLDGDGRLDLVHGPPRKSLRPPVAFLGDGRGGWRPWREAVFPRLPYDYGDARVGDLDGDGRPDLVLAVHLKGVIALRAEGGGRFADWGRGLDLARGQDPGFPSRAVRLVDWDGDGRLDILALGEGPRLVRAPGGAAGAPGPAAAQGVVLYLNQGDGSWVRRAGPPGARAFGTSLAVADLDGDGRPDFATGSSVFGRQDLVHLADATGGWRAVVVPEVRPRAYVRAVAARDFDGDGRADLALAYQTIEPGAWWAGIDVLLARPEGGWRRVVLAAEEGRGGAQALAAGDVDGDGRPDLAAAEGRGRVVVFLGDGRGGFTRERQGPAFGAACRGAHVALADLDGDGADEVMASFAEERGSLADGEGCPSEGGLGAWRARR
jgi:hypothetical protein